MLSQSGAGAADILPFRCPKIAERIVRYVLTHYADDIALDDLAAQVGMSRFAFCRRFHRECGQPPMRWLWGFRTLLAAEFIKVDPRWSLTDIAFACGFTSSAHFSRSFRTMFGKTPSQFRQEMAAHPEGPATAERDVFANDRAPALRAFAAALTARLPLSAV